MSRIYWTSALCPPEYTEILRLIGALKFQQKTPYGRICELLQMVRRRFGTSKNVPYDWANDESKSRQILARCIRWFKTLVHHPSSKKYVCLCASDRDHSDRVSGNNCDKIDVSPLSRLTFQFNVLHCEQYQ